MNGCHNQHTWREGQQLEHHIQSRTDKTYRLHFQFEWLAVSKLELDCGDASTQCSSASWVCFCHKTTWRIQSAKIVASHPWELLHTWDHLLVDWHSDIKVDDMLLALPIVVREIRAFPVEGMQKFVWLFFLSHQKQHQLNLLETSCGQQEKVLSCGPTLEWAWCRLLYGGLEALLFQWECLESQGRCLVLLCYCMTHHHCHLILLRLKD